ncbi:MAB_1171c family putative transporter, partial [Streptomyces sp900116325]|uniref:MAB_1171c family putative transporter n=1 Tax=Streptomyces sp. 900116325 TaxID=3154295 RepID=UPI0033F3464B
SHDPAYQAYVFLYFGTYAAAEIYLARACWQYARTASKSSIAFSLRLITIGAIITLGYSLIRIGAVVGVEAGFSVERFNSFAWACGDIGTTSTQVGYFLPILTLRIGELRGWTIAHLRYRSIYQLWAALDQADLGITLRRPVRQRNLILRGRSAELPLLRRSTEIRAGQKMLRRFVALTAREQAETIRHAEGLNGADLAAAVTADQIRDALIRHQADDPVGTPTTYADAHLPLATTEDELRHLQRVASYFTPDRFECGDDSDSLSTTSGARISN